MRVALYARVSLPTRDRDKDTKELKYRQEVDNQLVPLREYVARREWAITKEYVDRATGKNDERPKFREMFASAAKHEFDVVMFWSLDRFSREGPYETMGHLRVLSDYGVKWKSYTEQYLDSLGPFGEAILGILACIAKQERIRIQERVLAGLDRARAKGVKLGRRRTIYNKQTLLEDRQAGMSLSQLSKKHKIPRPSVARYLKELMNNASVPKV